jgi:hypothetical protein
MISEDSDSILGPGTDLVISLFAISLVLIVVLSGLYFQLVDKAQILQRETKDSNARLDATNKELDKVLKDYQLLRREKLGLLGENYPSISELENILKKLETLEDRNKWLEIEIHHKNNYISQLTANALKEGHNNTPIPKRSTKDKEVFRVYAEGSPSNYTLYYKFPDGTDKIKISRNALHYKLKRIKDELGSNLYVAVIVPDSFPVSIKKSLECEFWRYDYYQYFDRSYCK